MATTAAVRAAIDSNTTMEVDEVSLDANEIDEYREMIEELGTFPDKVLINSLTMVAEDHANSKESAQKVYDCIRGKLLSSAGDHKLPIMYVIDSILKNARGAYIGLFEDDAKTWMSSVYRSLPDETTRSKLKRVWKTWNDFSLFPREKWMAIGECFEGDDVNNNNLKNNNSQSGSLSPRSSSPLGSSTTVAGIPRSKTGSLILSTSLRKEMQKILDELQNDIDNELEKVSLERLADINPDLLANIKQAAEDQLHGGNQSTLNNNNNNNGGMGSDANQDGQRDPMKPSYLVEVRSDDIIHQSKAWTKLELKYVEHSNDIIQKLKTCVKDGSSPDARYTQSDAIDMTHVLAAASAAAGLLSRALERRSSQEKKSNQKSKLPFATPGSGSGSTGTSGYSSIDKALFTNDGIKEKNLAFIGLLYEVGLPFVSSSDGRRFKAQMDLSKHLDKLFKRSQIEKSMARTEERGWYVSDRVWTGESNQEETENAAKANATETATTTEDDDDPDSFTEVADESRDRCVICGLNFKMFFDNDDGAYKYRNCREIEVMNDDVAENESDLMLIHVTCWRGLGSPATLEIDQTLRE